MPSYSTKTPERERRVRFVTLCQQLLALAVVVAVLTPAARTVTMDVRPAQPVDVASGDVSLRAAAFPSKVPTGSVAVDVEEYALTAPSGKAGTKDLRVENAVKGLQARRTTGTGDTPVAGGEVITSEELPVEGYGTVGVTWSQRSAVADDEIGVEVRTRTGDTWSGWTTAEYHDEHGPDPTSAEGKHARPGTDALLVGEVDAVQVKVAAQDAAPADLKVAVIAPGTPDATSKQLPAIDTSGAARVAGTPATETPAEPAEPADAEPADADSIALQAGTPTPKPMIYSRAQWGANEKMRDASSLAYYEVHGGFVHHTVNANGYTAEQVPAIIRGIYSYHTKTRGWSDIGYNFLVDRFGRIWEGRAGGVDRAVVGAHTQNYNNYSFAMSAIGNFDTVKPGSKIVKAYGALFAWKLALHGVSAASGSQRIGSKYFPAINGHRDAGSTACPGRYLYAKLPKIRKLAAAAQRGWAGREVTGNYAGGGVNDLVVRRSKDRKLVTLAIGQVGGVWKVTHKIDSGRKLGAKIVSIHRAGDWDQDGFDDVIARKSNGALLIFRGKGNGTFYARKTLSTKLAGLTLVAVPGDVTGDGYPDLMGQLPGGSMRIYPGRGAVGLGTSTDNLPTSYAAYSKVKGKEHIPAGLVNADGAPDSLIRKGKKMVLYTGNGPGGWTSQRTIEVSPSGYDWLVGVGRVTSDGLADFVGRAKGTGELFLLPGNGSAWGSRISLGVQNQFDLAG